MDPGAPSVEVNTSGSLPRKLADLDESLIRPDRGFRVPGARVVYADYPLLLRDFPALLNCGTAACSGGDWGTAAAPDQRALRAQVDRWLIRNAALVSESQLQPNEVNSPIFADRSPVPTYRPPRYGRSFLREVDPAAHGSRDQQGRTPGVSPSGLLDLKGVGVARGEKPKYRRDGLLTVGGALEEVMTTRLLDAVFDHAGVSLRTLPVYAVLDLGFDILLDCGSRFGAGVLVRRAHRRNSKNVDLPEHGSVAQGLLFSIEMILRNYGITSCNEDSTFELFSNNGQLACRYGGEEVRPRSEALLKQLWEAAGPAANHRRLEGINVQTTRFGDPSEIRLVDFGHYRIRPRFDHPVVSTVSNRDLRIGGVFRVDHPAFVQPQRALAVSMDEWGDIDDPYQAADLRDFSDLLAEWCWPDYKQPPVSKELIALGLAHGFRTGLLSSDAVTSAISSLIGRVLCRWESTPHARLE